MYNFPIDGRLQVTAGASLLIESRLVDWNSEQARFWAVPRDMFESSWQQDRDPAFGRLECWILFSAGAEMLAKGLCLLHQVEIRFTKLVPAYPTKNFSEWSTAFIKKWQTAGVMTAVNYGTIRNLVDRPYPKTNLPPAFPRLFAKVGATAAQADRLLAAYQLLATTVRNRDAHSYVPNVRDHHGFLVAELFTDCFNDLVSWLPDGRATLSVWRQEAQEFIRFL
jgi:hypothetical protein